MVVRARHLGWTDLAVVLARPFPRGRELPAPVERAVEDVDLAGRAEGREQRADEPRRLGDVLDDAREHDDVGQLDRQVAVDDLCVDELDPGV
jgi:hypothetical protein